MKTRQVPFSGGAKAALVSRGGESVAQAFRRLWTAVRH
jgi:hypothetical protein